MSDIVCLGEPLVEFNQQADGRYLRGCGGDTSNVAVAAARQGASVAMIARIGADAFGDQLLAMWQQEGVATQWVSVDNHAPTGLYFVHHVEGGHRFTYRRSGSAAALMRPEDLPMEAVRAAKVLHVSGISQAISASAADACFAAMAAAREAGVDVSYDLNLRRQLWPLERARATIHGAMGFVTVALPGLDDARALCGLDAPEDIVRFYQRLGPSIVALTLGTDGVLVADGDALHTVPARSASLVDASGAGDCFDGAFLAEWLSSGDTKRAAAYANCAASLSVEGYGAVTPIPRRTTVEGALPASD